MDPHYLGFDPREAIICQRLIKFVTSMLQKRRDWDSNPGAPFGGYTLSRRAPSTNSDISPKKVAG